MCRHVGGANILFCVDFNGDINQFARGYCRSGIFTEEHSNDEDYCPLCVEVAEITGRTPEEMRQFYDDRAARLADEPELLEESSES